MAVLITGVEPGSLAQRHGLKPGMTLLSLNGHPIRDVLDYRFYLMESRLTLVLEEEGKQKTLRLHKRDEYDDIGLEFETYLMDKQRSCRNNCVFCFVDQLPKGLRDTLYFKDDDDRLSFLLGNYVTLTNLSSEEVERLCQMHISPINVSVHTMNPELRVKMMGNRFAGEVLGYLSRFAAAGISLNTQLVLCPGWNDGAELDRSLRELGALYPAVQSIALVPVGLTKYREGLCPLSMYTREGALEVIRQADAFNDAFMKDGNPRLAFPADEFFLKAELPVPDAAYYETFDQLENGVGMLSLLWKEVQEAADRIPPDSRSRRVTLATGVAATPLMKIIVDFLHKRWHNLNCEVVTVENRFFGSTVTVAGLVTGGDLLQALEGRSLGDALLIPAVMLRREGDLFLDSIPLTEVRERLAAPVYPVPNDGDALVRAILGLSDEQE